MRVMIVDKQPDNSTAPLNALAARNNADAFHSAEVLSRSLDEHAPEEHEVVLPNGSLREMSEFQLVQLLKKLNLLTAAVIVVTTRRESTAAKNVAVTTSASATTNTHESSAAPCPPPSFYAELVHEALDRPSSSLDSPAIHHKAAVLAQLSKLPANPSKIAVAVDGSALLIDLSDVIAIKAEGNYVSLVRLTGAHLVRGRISTLASALAPYGFVQIHRCVLVNASWVDGIQPRPTGDYLLSTRGGKEYPVSRTYKQNLRSLAPLWIGSDFLFTE
jgi:DNA-binding LytR/AlgR family response regulator